MRTETTTRLMHHSLDLGARQGIECWADEPRDGDIPMVTIYLDDSDAHTIDLTPTEARAYAAVLILAAETQERRK